MMTRRLDLHCTQKNAGDLADASVSVASAQCLAYVEFVVVEQTQMELAVSRQPHPVAAPAIRLADRADKADHSARARQSIITRLVRRIISFQLLHRAEHGLDSAA